MVSLRPLAALPVVGVVADGRTYRHLLYLLVAVVLWTAYSGVAAFAVVFGFVLSLVLVGIGVLIAAVIGSRPVAGLERWLANRLLGTDLVAPDDLSAGVSDGSGGATATVRAYLTAPSTWRGLGFLSLKFWVALLAFAPLYVVASSLRLVAAPVRYPYGTRFGELNGEPVVWSIDTAPEAALAAGVGVAGLLVGLHLTNLIAGGARLMAVSLLGDGSGSTGADESDDAPVTADGDAAGRGDDDPADGEANAAESDARRPDPDASEFGADGDRTESDGRPGGD